MGDLVLIQKCVKNVSPYKGYRRVPPHPNVAFIEDQGIFTSDEYGKQAVEHSYKTISTLQNKSLENFIRTDLNEQTVKIVLLQLAHAVHHLHKNGWTHGDIKLRNIYLSESKEQIVLTVLDKVEHVKEQRKQKDITELRTVFESILKMNDQGKIQGIDFMVAEDLVEMMRSAIMDTETILQHPYFWDTEKKLNFLSKVTQFSKSGDIGKPFKDALNQRSEEVFGSKGWAIKLLITDEKELDNCNSMCLRRWSTRYGHCVWLGTSDLQLKPNPLRKDRPTRKKQLKQVTRDAIEKLTTMDMYKKHPLYTKEHLQHLLNFIRNRREHFWEDSLEVQACFAFDDTAGFWNFFGRRFPRLFLVVYDVTRNLRKADRLSSCFETYFVTTTQNASLPRAKDTEACIDESDSIKFTKKNVWAEESVDRQQDTGDDEESTSKKINVPTKRLKMENKSYYSEEDKEISEEVEEPSGYDDLKYCEPDYEEIWRKVEKDILKCSICLDIIKTPKFLPCKHSFCLSCLKNLEELNEARIECPLCRAYHDLPSKGCKGFLDNVTMVDLLHLRPRKPPQQFSETNPRTLEPKPMTDTELKTESEDEGSHTSTLQDAIDEEIKSCQTTGVFSRSHEQLDDDDIRYMESCFKSLPEGFTFKKLKLRNCNLKNLMPNGLFGKKVETLNVSANKDLKVSAAQIASLKDLNTESIDLSDCNLGEEEMENLSKVEISILKLNYKSFICGSISIKLKSILMNRLKTLQLANSPITVSDLKDLAEGLSEEKIMLEKLDLSFVHLNEEGMEAVAGIVNCTHGMQKLGLSDCAITTAGLKRFHDDVHEKVDEVDLSYNDEIDEEGDRELCKTVNKCQIMILDISGRELTGYNIAVMRNEEAELESKVRELNLRENPEIDTAEVGKLTSHWELKHLNMSECQLEAESLDKFAKNIGEYKLESLDISDQTERPTDEKVNAMIGLLQCVKGKLIFRCQSLSEQQQSLLEPYNTEDMIPRIEFVTSGPSEEC